MRSLRLLNCERIGAASMGVFSWGKVGSNIDLESWGLGERLRREAGRK
jgi:hypothetical protein